MTAENYGETRLSTIASQFSRVVENDTQEGSTTYCISKGIRELYDNGICDTDITASLMVQAWKLTLLTELVNEVGNKELQEIVADKAKDFVNSIERLGIQNILRNKLEYDI